MCRQLIIVMVLLMASNSLKAQCLGSCCSVASGTDITNQSSASVKGDWQISAGFSSMQYHPFTNDELTSNSTMENAVFTVQSQQSAKIGMQYNLTNRVKVSASIPYNASTDNREGHTHTGDYKEVHDYGNVRGVGDATFIGAYEWLPKNEHGWRFSTGIGIKVPTGQTQVLSSNGIGVPMHLEPGTGSWDPVATAVLKKESRRWILSLDAYGKIATTANEHNMGDYVSGTSSAFLKALNKPGKTVSKVLLFGALQCDHNAKMTMPENHIHSVSDTSFDAPITTFENSGFTRLFFSGGTLVSFGRHITIPFSLSLPVYQYVNGYQVRLLWKSTLGLTMNF